MSPDPTRPAAGRAHPLRLGMLTPSSDTVLEPMMADEAPGQFSANPMLAAAELLSHAKVDVISWNGTSASWLGFPQDEALCAGIEDATGIPASICDLPCRDAGLTGWGSLFSLPAPERFTTRPEAR